MTRNDSASKLANVTQEIAKLKEEKKDFLAGFKEALKELEASQKLYAAQVKGEALEG